MTLAIRFHETYERLAPSFGYETRTETRQFDPSTPNGKLMIAVCAELLRASSPGCKHEWVSGDNKYVTGVSICLKCHTFVATSSLSPSPPDSSQPVNEKGPWRATYSTERVTHSSTHYILSDDFTHDVALFITGDFGDHATKTAYAEEIARRLNAYTIPPPSSPQVAEWNSGDLWSFMRSVLEHGRSIEMDNNAGRYPQYEMLSARIDAAARERADEFSANFAAPQPAPKAAEPELTEFGKRLRDDDKGFDLVEKVEPQARHWREAIATQAAISEEWDEFTVEQRARSLAQAAAKGEG